MEHQIIENIEKLYRSHTVDLIIYLALIAITFLVVLGVIKCKLLDSKLKNTALVVLTALASVVLIAVQFVTIVPVYKDYAEQAYIVIEDAKVIIEDGTRSGLESTSRVIVRDGDREFELKMQTDYSLETRSDYTGKIAYLKNSNYLIWYDFNEN